jgi:Protein of unknown function (DUF3300)
MFRRHIARNLGLFMTMTLSQKALAVLMSSLMVATTVLNGAALPTQQQQAPDADQNANVPAEDDYAPLTADELDGVVAPIALYPDALVAQVLGAASFPDQITTAAFWLRDNSSLKGDALMKAVDSQDWDPAVKALSQFPSVLDILAKNLAWTSTLGEAAATQQADVMAAIQRMRAKAEAAGNLKSSSEIKVVQQAPQTIVIQPANPQVVYVPTYNPTVVYGAPVVVPGYSSGDLAAAAVISFGAGIAVGALISNNNYCCGWGWSNWNTNWGNRTVIYNRNVYVGNPYWRGGGRYPGYRPGYPSYGRPPYYRPPSGRPPGGRPVNGRPPYRPPNGGRPPYQPGTRPPSGNRPGRPTIQPVPGPGTRPGKPARTKPGRDSGRNSGRNPGTNPGTRPGRPSTRPTANSPRPDTQPARGYPQKTNNGSRQSSKPNAFSSGGRPASTRGNQSLGNGGRSRGGKNK